ncbi:hypothetical protein BH09CHL1_BH09CHL1_09580 [soil metagenome]
MTDSTPIDLSKPLPLALVPIHRRVLERNRIPIPLTPFLGREEEIARTLSLLRSGGRRLITLSGTGGVGKTRLAIEVANRADETVADDVLFVNVSSIPDAQFVAAEIARALNIVDDREEQQLQRIVAALRERRVLLVLDGFEHLYQASTFLIELISTSPHLKVLVTSRRVLRVSGELNVPVAPFGPIDLEARQSFEECASSDAVQLFVERATAANGAIECSPEAMETIAAICNRLDGLPLAIELAAAQTAVFDLSSILNRIERQLPLLIAGPPDAPERQRTLDATIDWSYRLLSPQDQDVLRRISVCVGSITLSAGISLARSTTTSESQVVLSIDRLLGMSLLTRQTDGESEPRFVVLQTVRQYALKQLEERAELAELSRLHAIHFTEFAETAAPELYGGLAQRVWLNRLATEHDNVRAALTWSLTKDTELGSRLAGSMYWFWYLRGYLSEGIAWLEQFNARADSIEIALRARLKLGLGMLLHRRGDDGRAVALFDESASQLRRVGNRVDAGLAIGLPGVVAEDNGDFEQAVSVFTEGLAWLESSAESRTHPLVGLTLAHLGVVSWGLNRPSDAHRFLERAISVHHSAGDEWGVANAAAFLGLLACQGRDFDRAAMLLQESLATFWAFDSLEEVSNGLASIATLAGYLGEHAVAARLFGHSTRLRERIGSQFRLPERGMYEAAIASVTLVIGDAFSEAWSGGLPLTTRGAVEEAINFAEGVRNFQKPPESSMQPIRLTAREKEVLLFLAEGRTDKEIAAALFISPRTAQGHVARLCAKLGANSRTSAVSIAHRSGLVSTISE